MDSKKSLFSGVMIISGTMIGAGMFSLPIVMSGMWFYYAIILLIISWYCMLMSGLMLLEANLNYPAGASFHTITRDLLGKKINIINGLSISFVLYILTYAYISGTGAALHQTLQHYFSINMSAKSYAILFALLGAIIVWISTQAVGRLITLFLVAKILAFLLTFGALLYQVAPIQLLNFNTLHLDYLKYLPYGAPFCLIAFGYQSNIPSLVKYFGKNPTIIVKSIYYGTLVALILYIVWLTATFGNIPRHGFKSIIAAGANIDVLMSALENNLNGEYINLVLIFFSNFAVISSFLGVTIGLFDYIADLCHFDNTKMGRLKTACLTFIPPIFAATLYPNGFIYAIGLAGLCATLWAVIIPALLAKQSRKKWPHALFRTWGGNTMILIILGFGFINIAIFIAAALHFIPNFS